MTGECRICKKTSDLREGGCWDCATAESIIDEGVDMFDKGLNGSKEPCKTPANKIRLLIQNGWKKL